MKKRKRLSDLHNRIIAAVLSLAMLFAFAPTVIAEDAELVTDAVTSLAESPPAQEAVTAVEEIAELRDGFSKTFLLSDGTYKQVSFASPVHYEKDGTWQEIDNSLSLNVLTNKHTTADGSVSFSKDTWNNMYAG